MTTPQPNIVETIAIGEDIVNVAANPETPGLYVLVDYATGARYNHLVRYDPGLNLIGALPVAEGPIAVAVHPDGRYFVSLRDDPRVAVYDAGFVRTGFMGDGDPLVSFIRPMPWYPMPIFTIPTTISSIQNSAANILSRNWKKPATQ